MAKILMVDDSDDACEPLAAFIRTAGHDVTCARNGREALGVILVETPDVILLDLWMRDLDGPSFLEIVRSYLRMRHLPVVVLTGMIDSPMIGRVRALSVNSILIKGKATPEEILEGVKAATIRHPG